MGQDMETSTDQYASNGSAVQWKDKTKGGFKASGFIFALMAMESMGFVANMCSLVLFFMSYFDPACAANTLTNFMGATFLLSIVGAFISDTYLNRFTTCMIFGALEVVGLALLVVQSSSSKLHTDLPCTKSSCMKVGPAFLLYSALSFLAIGSGGVRGSLVPLGADQFDQNDPKEAKTLATYFNWQLLSTISGAFVGVTAVVYVATEVKWFWGFLISTLATFIGFFVFGTGKNFYRLQPPGDGPMVRIGQVIFVTIKNRNLSLPDKSDELYEISEKERVLAGEERVLHTPQFRWLDKAAIVREDKQAIQWEVCSVTQVEEVKVLIRMLPILFSTIIMNTCLAQLQTFSIVQGYFMNPLLGKFKVPAPSIPAIPIFFMIILVPVYEYAFVPFARKFTHHPNGISQLQRVGVGLVLSAVSMATAGLVELKRRNEMNQFPPKQISLFWLSFQYGIFGIADMFTLVGLLEFFYKEAPIGMRSLSTSFTWLSLSFGYFLSSIFVTVINAVTKRVTPSKLGWLHGQNINQNNVNLFYWFLAIVSCLNFLNYLYWASWYKYKQQEPAGVFETKTTFFDKEEESKQDVVEVKEMNQVPLDDQTEDAKQEDKASSVGPTDVEATENKTS
ncbi:hypothetical protein ACFE04_027939 [Oxalis oulophora]